MGKYIGITIGPILSTMSLVSTPAALWASSYLFSFINRTICETLVDQYHLSEESIVVPCYKKDMQIPNDGVGRFHDHIIFKQPEGDGVFTLGQFGKLKKTVYGTVAAKFGITTDYLNDYVMLTAVAYEADNAIIGASRPLDSAELSYTLPCREGKNELLVKFTGDSDDEGQRNDAIKKIAKDNLGIAPQEWQLLDRGNIRSLPRIADCGGKSNDKLKKHRYYAVVRADGDKMSDLIAKLEGDTAVRNFSEACLNYCKAISEKVNEFSGMTVYASGDDLLALLPCAIGNQTVFDFVAEANKVLKKCFSEEVLKQFLSQERIEEVTNSLSLSWGILICYDHYPLYEALNESADLLFGEAKAEGMKNCTAVKLVKNSGQSAHFILPNRSLPEYIELQKKVLDEVKPDEAMMLSVLYKIQEFAALFDNTRKYRYDLLCRNIFDGSPKEYQDFLYKTLPLFISKMKANFPIYSNTEKLCNAEDTLCQVLRMQKFFTEKVGAERKAGAK